MKKGWSINFKNSNQAKEYELFLSTTLLRIIVIFMTIITLLFLTGLVYNIYYGHKIIKAELIYQENEILREKLYTISNSLDSLITKIKLMETWEDQIREDMNLKKIKQEIRQMGIGGMPVDTTLSFSNEDIRNLYIDTDKKFKQLTGKINFGVKTHKEVADKYALRKELYRNTPSIYPTYGRFSDAFGWRTHPLTGRRTFHHGLDLANKRGTPIYATADGTIQKTCVKRLIGKYIVIKHKFGYETRYGHLSRILVKEGSEVKKGQHIGLMGNTGRSTGTHLHYEVLRYNRYRNPYYYLNKSKDDIIFTRK